MLNRFYDPQISRTQFDQCNKTHFPMVSSVMITYLCWSAVILSFYPEEETFESAPLS